MIALFFLAGLIFLLTGAHLLVDSATGMAARFGIPSLIIGLTIVAFATSAPEIAVSLDAALNGRAGLAIGNVVGSNIANILLIIGLSSIFSPIKLHERVAKQDLPIMVGISLAVYLLALDYRLGFLDGIVMLLLFCGFIIFQINQSRKQKASVEFKPPSGISKRHPLMQLLYLLAGLGLLVTGAQWLVDSSIAIARVWGFSELVIGLTIIAIGTSLPELATSMMAAWKKEPDISAGNVIGSNIFNLLLILGLVAVFSGDGLSVSRAALALDLPFMIAVSIACLPVFFTGLEITRWEGYLFVGYYAAYLLYLFLDSTQHELLPLFNTVMALFVAPITGATLLIFALRYWRNRRRKR
ncbi:MAG: calcium/sodium antiporter [Balneolaceae bacterium]|nr:calcium/sodium antiporter [Balneolaceae bacterium]